MEWCKMGKRFRRFGNAKGTPSDTHPTCGIGEQTVEGEALKQRRPCVSKASRNPTAMFKLLKWMNTYICLSDKKLFVNRTLKSGSLTKLTPPVPRPLHKSPANAHWIPLISSTCIPRQTIWRCLDFVASPEPRFLYAACWNMLESDRGSSKLSPYLGSHKMVRWFKTFCKMLHLELVSDPIYSLHQPAMFHVR